MDNEQNEQQQIPKPDMPGSLSRDVHEHEVVLSFNSDWHAAAFHDWWDGEGFIAFEAFAQANKANY